MSNTWVTLEKFIERALNNWSTSDTAINTVSPNVATSSVVIVQPNPNRRGLFLWNNGANTVYVVFGRLATSSTTTISIPTFVGWEHRGNPIYTGVISAIRNAGTGTVVVTELI